MPRTARAPIHREQRKRGKMNQTEERYYGLLRGRQFAGEITEIWYESLTLVLADNCRYTPDFLVQLTSGELECHEVKGGFVRDDARVKLKVAAQQYPFRFILAQEVRKRWALTDMSGAATKTSQ